MKYYSLEFRRKSGTTGSMSIIAASLTEAKKLADHYLSEDIAQGKESVEDHPKGIELISHKEFSLAKKLVI